VLDQFSTRFGKLQDLMGAKLFPGVLELTKEPGELKAFIDKLYRLEKNRRDSLGGRLAIDAGNKKYVLV